MEVTHSSPGKEGLLSLLAALPSLTAGSSRSLHNVTYVTYVPPDCPIPPGAGEAPRTAPPRPAAALTGGGKSCGVPLGIFPSGFWEGETSAQALCLRACACAKRREGEAPAAIARLPPRAWLPHAGAGQRRGPAASAPLSHSAAPRLLSQRSLCLSCPFFPVIPLRLTGVS